MKVVIDRYVEVNLYFNEGEWTYTSQINGVEISESISEQLAIALLEAHNIDVDNNDPSEHWLLISKYYS